VIAKAFLRIAVAELRADAGFRAISCRRGQANRGSFRRCSADLLAATLFFDAVLPEGESDQEWADLGTFKVFPRARLEPRGRRGYEHPCRWRRGDRLGGCC